METDVLKIILKNVENTLGVRIPKNQKHRGKFDVSDAKKIYFHQARNFTLKPWESIAGYIGKTHATAIHGYKACDEFMEYDKEFGQKYNLCLIGLNEKIEKHNITNLNKLKRISASEAKELRNSIKQHLQRTKKIDDEIKKHKDIFKK